jgi:murein DD-endopeptidase MepM/ murein hydrolase activator NlpD
MAARAPSWPVSVTGIDPSEGTFLPNPGGSRLSSGRPARLRSVSRRDTAVIVVAAILGFVAGLAAMTLLLFVFGGRPALISARPPAAGVATVDASGTVPPSATAASPAEADAETIARTAVSELQARRLEIPIAAVDRRALPDTFDDHRGTPRRHEAMDLPAPRDTAVLAVEDGTIARLYEGTEGGTGLYQLDPSGAYAYYYAHLDRYADGLEPGQAVTRGQVLGYVGTSGIVPAERPQLHFAIYALSEARRWWDGVAIDPLAVLQ